jgi:hypothetical protein
MLSEAKRLGAKILLDSEVISVGTDKGQVTLKRAGRSRPMLLLERTVRLPLIRVLVYQKATTSVSHRCNTGTWSIVRDAILDHPSTLAERGDLAYRATFTLDQLKALGGPEIERLCQRRSVMVWLGPERYST